MAKVILEPIGSSLAGSPAGEAFAGQLRRMRELGLELERKRETVDRKSVV